MVSQTWHGHQSSSAFGNNEFVLFTVSLLKFKRADSSKGLESMLQKSIYHCKKVEEKQRARKGNSLSSRNEKRKNMPQLRWSRLFDISEVNDKLEMAKLLQERILSCRERPSQKSALKGC